MPFWDEVCRERCAEYDGIDLRQVRVDALAALFVLKPRELDVVVASNLFGDILKSGRSLSFGISPVPPGRVRTASP
jgi:tartrate dehydrogenase/decarboxylase / D-malate dehydrogenase